MRETWYVLEDGSKVHPSEIVRDKKTGGLVHKSGVAVAMKGDVPHSYSVDPDEERAKSKKKAPADPPIVDPEDGQAKDAQPEEQKRGYKTREAKVK